MKKTEIISRVKTVLNEILSPGTASLTVTLTEQPLDTFLDSISTIALSSLYHDIPSSIITPLSIEYIKVSEYNAGLIKFDDSYDISSLTIDSFSGIGSIKIIEIVSHETDIPSSSGNYMIEGTLFTCSAEGEIYLNSELDTLDVSENDIFIYSGDRFYQIDSLYDIGDYFICMMAPDGNNGYFRNILLSDTTYISLPKNVIKGEENTYTLDYTGNIEYAPWVKGALTDFISYYLPDSFISLESLKFSSWQTSKPKVISVDDPFYIRQQNKYMKAGYIKPVVAIGKDYSGLSYLEVYSLKDETDTFELGFMIQTVPCQFIQDDLIDHYTWLIAYHYLIAIGNNGAQTAMNMYQKKIKEL